MKRNRKLNPAEELAYLREILGPDNEKILRAAQILVDEGIAHPILIGNRKKVLEKMEELNIELRS